MNHPHVMVWSIFVCCHILSYPFIGVLPLNCLDENIKSNQYIIIL